MVVPSMLIVAPSGSTKREIGCGTPSFSSATRMVVGKVAAEDEVENAVIQISRVVRMYQSGSRFPTKRSSGASTSTACATKASTTTPVYSASATSTSTPNLATTMNTSGATP